MGRVTESLLVFCLLLLCSPVWADEQGDATPQTAADAPTPDDKAEARSESASGDTRVPDGPVDTHPQDGPLPATIRAEPVQASPKSDEARARASYRRGDALYLEGDYAGAVTAFEEAYALSGRIEMLFNLANAHERLGNYAEAALSLRGYIPHSPDSDRPTLERRLARLERLEKEKQERLDAWRQAQTPPAEAHKISLRKGTGIGLLTLGGVGLIAGTGLAIATASARGELNDMCGEGEEGRLCPPEAEPIVNRDKSLSIATDVSLIVGTACAITGIVLILQPNKKSNESGLRMRAGLSAQRFWLSGEF